MDNLNITTNYHFVRNKELHSLILGRKGGKTTTKIIDAILEQPRNANQLSHYLKLDYHTVRYHLDILCTHDFATKKKFGKYSNYYPSDTLIKNIEEYILIKENLKKNNR